MTVDEAPNSFAEVAGFHVHDRPDVGRYELVLDGEVVGFARYLLDDAVLTIPHVETHREHRGKDFAARLMDGLLRDARRRSLTVHPTCSYAAAYMRRHTDSHDLFATD